jgi:hypothetical protein
MMPRSSTSDRLDALSLAVGRGRVALGGLVQLVRDHGDALQRVVVHLTSHPRALLFLRAQQLLRVPAVQSDEASLVDDQRRHERDENDRESEARGYKDFPDVGRGRGHSMPTAMRTNAKMSRTTLVTSGAIARSGSVE